MLGGLFLIYGATWRQRDLSFQFILHHAVLLASYYSSGAAEVAPVDTKPTIIDPLVDLQSCYVACFLSIEQQEDNETCLSSSYCIMRSH